MLIKEEAFPLARSQENKSPQSLDATGIKLDNAYLRGADLQKAWMPQASLQKADLRGADLSGANLFRADLNGARIWNADLRGADLNGANLRGAVLTSADLNGADLSGANLNAAILTRVDLNGADLHKADLSAANLEEAVSLEGTNLRGATGLTKEQVAICKAKGAIIDETPTASPPQAPVSPPPPEPRNDVQAQSALSAQGSIPTPETDESNAPSSKPAHES